MFNKNTPKSTLIPVTAVTITAEALTIPAGAAGTIKEVQLANRPVLNATGGAVGGKGDTSLTFGTGTCFTTEVSANKLDADLANGEYWIDYVAGVIHGKKADAAVADTATYKVLSLLTDSGTDLSTLLSAVKNEDAAASGGDAGMHVLVVRRDTAASSAGTDGDYADIGLDALGHMWVREGYAPGYEDNVANVAKVEERYSSSGVLLVDTQIKASAGFVHAVTISQNDAAPTAGTIDIYDNTSAAGTKIFTWTLTTAVFVPFTVVLDVSVANGIYLDFTTTADVAVAVSYR